MLKSKTLLLAGALSLAAIGSQTALANSHRHHAWRYAGYAAQYQESAPIYFVKEPRTIDDFPVAGN